MMIISLRLVLTMALLALGVSMADPTLAQDQSFRSADAQAGKPVRLGIHGNVSKECAAGALPEIKVVTPPKHGALSLKSGKSKAGELRGARSLRFRQSCLLPIRSEIQRLRRSRLCGERCGWPGPDSDDQDHCEVMMRLLPLKVHARGDP